MSKHNSKLVIRITILGDKSTGKTSLLKSYLGDQANQKTQNVENSGSAYVCDTVVDDTNVTQQILDSDGKHTAVTAWAHGVIVMFAVDNLASFALAEECIAKIKEVTMRDALIVLIGNKADVNDRSVSNDDGEKLAAKYNCDYVEFSVLYDEDSKVSNIFAELSQQILVHRGLKNTSILKRKPQLFRRMMNAMTKKSRSLSTVKETVMKETFI